MISAWLNLLQLCVASGILACLAYKVAQELSLRRRNRARLPLPPGPRGYPFIGNVLDMPTSQQWRVYADWAKVYGDIFSFKVLGQPIVVLNSLEVAQDLFDKRSANYSDRPRLPMLLELMNFGHIFLLLPYGSWWRRHRRSFNQHFHESIVRKYHPIQAQETRAFLNRLLHTPERFKSHTRQALAATIMSLGYGIEIQGFDDPYVVNIEESMHGLNVAGLPGSFLVDQIPALKYVPSWFPGAGFKRKAAHWAEVNRKVAELPFKHVAQQMKDGTASPSLAATLIASLPEGDEALVVEETKLAQNVVAIAYLAGADTTVSAIQTFFLAMALYPDVQKRAQAELDIVVGPHRLPEFSDRASLPYVNALIKETLRWQLVVPIPMAHMATDDDVYKGYFIPKGTIVLGNAWAMLHDERVFEDPEEFRPERYLKDGKLDLSVRQPEASAFGFGRRICPGRFLSDSSLFSMVSSTLHAFDITPALDKNGIPIPLSTQMTSGLVSYPEPFTIDIKPRSPAAEALIRDGILGDI
ncbi:hypothetical protein D9619_004660 [Psilocybe cf. subviscida]|uniref:Cytochrome P450 n=1 Tax=Psilocybe cf. subviscida TaxID=2480587 RepID=A0A8H5BPX9_9AGAR|nr:hypothetical protein D9619_004660 [Psilocybe cf. subviscida]